MTRRRLGRFFVVGVGSALAYFALNWALQARAHWSPFIATGFAYSCAFCAAYVLQHRWAFHSNALHSVSLPRYAMAQVVTAVLTAACTQAASYLYPGASAMLLAAGSTLLAGGCSFVLSSTWVFSHRASTPDSRHRND